jgi:transglutaminase-like putative cysteine protease
MTQTANFRNTAWLVGSLAIVVAPHAVNLPLWIPLVFVGIALWRLYAIRHQASIPGQRLLLLAAVAAALGVLATYHTLLGRDAGVALLIAMLSLKLMEIRGLRDVMVAIFLGYFLIITGFLYSQSILIGLYMLPAVLMITATMIGFQHPGDDAPWKRLRLAAVLLGQAVPVMLVLFVLFPRVPGPLWGLPRDAYAGMTGLSDTMAPGSISRLSQSGAVAFRVVFDGRLPPPAQRYWRGPVLNRFDGRTWSAGFFRPSSPAFVALGAPVGYTVTLESHNKHWLFALDLPASVPSGARMTGDFQLLSTAPVRQRLRYHVVSYPRYEETPELRVSERRRALQLPPDADPQARQLAASWVASGADARGIVARALAMFRNEPFVYTLTPPPLGQQPVDEFLFNTRRGFCEHYAGSFVFLMRAAGIPARVVTGYQGGDLNPLGNYLIVRQSDAHAWAEIWLENAGWVRVDPTAAVAPQRVESGIASAVAATEPLPILARADLAWLRDLGLAWDSLNNSWNQWVLGYGTERQMELLAGLGMGLASWQEMAAGLMAGIGILLTIFAAFMLWRLKPAPADPVVILYRRFCRKLARRGIVPANSEGPRDFAERVAAHRPELAGQVRAITGLYVALRYGPHPEASELQRLRQEVRAFRT